MIAENVGESAARVSDASELPTMHAGWVPRQQPRQMMIFPTV